MFGTGRLLMSLSTTIFSARGVREPSAHRMARGGLLTHVHRGPAQMLRFAKTWKDRQDLKDQEETLNQ